MEGLVDSTFLFHHFSKWRFSGTLYCLFGFQRVLYPEYGSIFISFGVTVAQHGLSFRTLRTLHIFIQFPCPVFGIPPVLQNSVFLLEDFLAGLQGNTPTFSLQIREFLMKFQTKHRSQNQGIVIHFYTSRNVDWSVKVDTWPVIAIPFNPLSCSMLRKNKLIHLEYIL